MKRPLAVVATRRPPARVGGRGGAFGPTARVSGLSFEYGNSVTVLEFYSADGVVKEIIQKRL